MQETCICTLTYIWVLAFLWIPLFLYNVSISSIFQYFDYNCMNIIEELYITRFSLKVSVCLLKLSVFKKIWTDSLTVLNNIWKDIWKWYTPSINHWGNYFLFENQWTTLYTMYSLYFNCLSNKRFKNTEYNIQNKTYLKCRSVKQNLVLIDHLYDHSRRNVCTCDDVDILWFIII